MPPFYGLRQECDDQDSAELLPRQGPKVEAACLTCSYLLTCRPTQIQAYLQLSSLFSALTLIFVGILFGILASFKLGRALLGQSTL